ncbi:MAG: hypothetical protein Q8R10_08840 [Pseudomonas sp.]|uniref:hypothetical protein n=1 Tax=Pseudomonas sp. TaxID=306 RepID=UPI0027367131|nr:hypothetical protein [Pseudomonas sp.]MDP3846514.1 hypothetical protein [Pseudomonas sp.]
MKATLRFLLWLIAAGLLLSVALVTWVNSLGKDDEGVSRPAYGSYTWVKPELAPGVPAPQPTPRGGPTPRADGYVVGSQGNDFILPPMPPERAMDIHRQDSVFANSKLKSCFWPGPKLRPGFYTTDPDDYGIENQMPDTMNTFVTAWFRIPAGAKIVVKGEFPRMRHWSFTTYTDDGIPRDALDDIDIEPDAGSFNPFRAGVPRDVSARRYSFSIESGEPPAKRPANTVYTLAAPGTAIGMHMRNYVPDRSITYLGSVAVPEVELHLADGTVLTGEDACAATAAPLRGKQVPITLPKAGWLAINNMPGSPADHTSAHDFAVEGLERFYNRTYMTLRSYWPKLALDSLAVEKGGFWSNKSTRYGYKVLSQAYGKVYVVAGKMPSTPHTWNGDPAPLDQHADMRYWSLCTVQSPVAGAPVDCLFDEAVLPTLDPQGNFFAVISRAPDRPSNATEACGVAWMEYGNGDGVPGGSPDYGSIINRHTGVNPNFKRSWFAVQKPQAENESMGEYLPYVINFREKAKFEALGCPVDKAKILAMTNK